MIKKINNCVGCPTEMGCDKDICSYYNTIELYCDSCNCETDRLFDLDGQELCLDCLINETEIQIEV